MSFQPMNVGTMPTNVTPLPTATSRNPRARRSKPAPGAGSLSQAMDADASVEMQFAASLEDDPDLITGGENDETLYRWTGVFWEEVSERKLVGRAMEFLRDHEQKAFSKREARSMVESAMAYLVMFKALPEPAQGDTKVTFVQLRNGVLELRNDGQLLAHRPAKRFGTTFCVQADLDWERVDQDGAYRLRPVDPASKFGGFLHRIAPRRDLQDYIAEALGSTLTTHNWQKAIWLHGSGGNGKGTLSNIIAAFHAKVAAFDLENLDKDFLTGDLVNATLVRVDESETVNAKKFKSWVGRDPQQINRKNKDPIQIRPKATFLLSMNETLRAHDHSVGFRRRICAIPMTATFHNTTGTDTDWHEQVTEDPSEMAVVLDWLLAGAISLVKRRRFMSSDEAPPEVRALEMQIQDDTDPLARWVHEHDVRVDTSVLTGKTAAYQAFRDQCQAWGFSPTKIVQDRMFWIRLRTLLPGVKDETHIRHEGGRVLAVPLHIEGVPSLRSGR